MMRKSLALVVPAILVGACSNPMQRFRQDIDRNEQAISDLRSYQAEQAVQVESLRNEIRSLTGRLDVIEHRSTSTIGSDITSLREDLSSLKLRVPPPAIVPVDELEADEVLVRSLPEDIQKLFSDGLTKVRAGNFEFAVPVLRNALDLSYGKDWSANVIFWLGISYEGLSDSRNALASYNEIATRFSKHPRAPLALYRQSEVLVRLGDKATAKLSLRKLSTDYPKSKEAALAKERLKNL